MFCSGQHVLNEIVDLERMGCPPEHLYIDIPAGDFYDPEETGTKQMPFMRARYDQVVSGYYTNHPREQINQVNNTRVLLEAISLNLIYQII